MDILNVLWPFCPKKWKQGNMNILTSMYLRCDPHIDAEAYCRAERFDFGKIQKTDWRLFQQLSDICMAQWQCGKDPQPQVKAEGFMKQKIISEFVKHRLKYTIVSSQVTADPHCWPEFSNLQEISAPARFADCVSPAWPSFARVGQMFGKAIF